MKYVRRFSDLAIEDVPLVGGKNASLGEMYRTLADVDVKVPNGFATTAAAYRYFIDHNNLREKIAGALAALDIRDTRALAVTGAKIRQWISHGTMPADLAEEILAAYKNLAQEYGPSPDVAVRSSATAEDLPSASFAGQQETYLNIRGSDNLLQTCKRVFASLFTDRAISYRIDKGFDHMDVALSIGVQKMVRADLGASGVMFTLDTESGFRDVVFITAAYGLGENVVQGSVNPDEFLVFKPTLAHGFRPIIQRRLGEKAIKMIYTRDAVAGHSTTNVTVRPEERNRFCLSDEDVLTLARYGVAIERHYSQKAGIPRPMDIEWAKDGASGDIFIVQARPETVKSSSDRRFQEVFKLKGRGKVLVQGMSVGQKIAAGRARVIFEATDMHQLQPGEVLITDITDPDWEPVMKIAGGIVTNRGGRTCHAAIVARELGIPAVVGCGNATERIPSDTDITVSCAEGATGYIYSGLLSFTKEQLDVSGLERPKTHIMLNVGNPEQALEVCQIPNDGVGLARLEFIINNSIGIHPHALLDYANLRSDLKAKIDVRIAGYKDPQHYYIDRLAEGVGTIAAAFFPRTVIVRMSDFKSNEYAELLGGEEYEPVEENPMIGFRGAARYPSEQFAPCFAMECAAMQRVRNEMGLSNVALMIPFVRSVDEARGVIGLMASLGLKRGIDGLKIYMMCEIPANALLAEQFLEHFDGFSIGSNDLTQLTLGVDRDSGLISGFDERNEAVLKLMEMAIAACRKHGKYVGICGQAPSDFPEITQWLVRQGIESISLNPDSVLRMTEVVLEIERNEGRPG
jgi:pyruvate,water dikinase